MKEQQRPAYQSQQANTRELNLDENDVIVPEEKIKRAVGNDKIKSQLQHSKLRAVIRSIDGAKNRSKALRKQMESDPDFKGFVDMLLQDLGYVNEHG